MESLAVPVGYGVELAVLLDAAARFGVGAVAQVDLGERAHRHQPDADLGIMATELRRRPRPVPAVERPPARSVRAAAAR